MTLTTLIVFYLVKAMILAVPVVLCLVLFFLIMLCVRWKTEYRKKHLKRVGVSAALLPLLIGLIYVTQWFVMLPLMGRDMAMEHEAADAKIFSQTTLVAVGDGSPDFSVVTLSGKTFALPQRDKVVLVNFFATWCGPCVIELPQIQRIWESHRDDDRFRMIVISREEAESLVREFQTEHGYTFPVAADTNRDIYSKFATETIPRTFIIDSDGKIAYATIGFREGDERKIEDVLNNLLDALP